MGLFRFLQKREIKIGDQIWMTKNLNVRKFRNGEIIPQAKTLTEWENALWYNKPACCYPDFNPSNGKKYGMLYNWYAVNDKRVLSPVGWSIPSYEELATLIHFLGGSYGTAIKLKSTTGWLEEGNGTNESGFSALPGGMACKPGTDYNNMTKIPFHRVGVFGSWWSASACVTNGNDAHSLSLDLSNDSTFVLSDNKNYGLSVRCLKNNENKLPKSYIYKNLKNRLQWVQNADPSKTKHKELLLRISEDDSDYYVRKKAFQKLDLTNSQKALFDTAVYDNNWDIQMDACKRIEDQSILAEILIKHYGVAKHIRDYIGYDLLDLITDQSLLLKIVIEAFELTARSNAVEKITDLNIVRQLISNTKSDVQARVVHLIKDQNWLKELAVNHDCIEVQTTAIRSIKDESYLIDIIRESENHEVKKAAFEHIKDQDILLKFFFNEKDENIRGKIIDNIINDELLLNIVIAEKIHWVKCKAAEKITGEKEINIILESESFKVIEVIIKNITNTELLLDILKNNPSGDVRKAVVRNKYFRNQDVLNKVALGDEDPQVRLATIEKIESMAVINNMALNDKDITVQQIAIDRVTEESILIQIHNSNHHISVKNRAFERCMVLGFHDHKW